MSRVFVLLVLLLIACEGETRTVPATQVTVRIGATPQVLQALATLRVQVASERGGVWQARSHGLGNFTSAQLRWPVDVAIIPEPGSARGRMFEVIVEARSSDDRVLVQQRALANFVPGEQRALSLELDPCGASQLGEICEPRSDCYGPACLTCVNEVCAPTPVYDPIPFPPDPDAGPEAVDGGRDAAPEPLPEAGPSPVLPEAGPAPLPPEPGPCGVRPDGDGDGAKALMCGGNDCDDGDPTRSPQSPEICNGKDDDCNGTPDDGAANDWCKARAPSGATATCSAGSCVQTCLDADFDLRDGTCIRHDGCAGVTSCQPGTCVDGLRTYSCSCPAGYAARDQTCLDTDPCMPNPCATDMICVARGQTHECGCPTGFMPDGAGGCVAVLNDPCVPSPCPSDATCVVALGATAQCICPQGRHFDGAACVDDDECVLDTDTCDDMPNACINQSPGYACQCPTGYVDTDGKGTDCQPPRCEMGFADCNDDLLLASGDRCETNTDNEFLNCGGCRRSCSRPTDGFVLCQSGLCVGHTLSVVPGTAFPPHGHHTPLSYNLACPAGEVVTALRGFMQTDESSVWGLRAQCARLSVGPNATVSSEDTIQTMSVGDDVQGFPEYKLACPSGKIVNVVRGSTWYYAGPEHAEVVKRLSIVCARPTIVENKLVLTEAETLQVGRDSDPPLGLFEDNCGAQGVAIGFIGAAGIHVDSMGTQCGNLTLNMQAPTPASIPE